MRLALNRPIISRKKGAEFFFGGKGEYLAGSYVPVQYVRERQYRYVAVMGRRSEAPPSFRCEPASSPNSHRGVPSEGNGCCFLSSPPRPNIAHFTYPCGPSPAPPHPPTVQLRQRDECEEKGRLRLLGRRQQQPPSAMVSGGVCGRRHHTYSPGYRCTKEGRRR